MKGVKLKPLYVKNDDILVHPPTVQLAESQFGKRSASHSAISGTTDLMNLVRGRKLKKHAHAQNNQEEVEQVKGLSEFRSFSQSPTKATRSPIRRYTFKRLGTMRLTEHPIFQQNLEKIVEESIVQLRQREKAQPVFNVIKALLTKGKLLKSQVSMKTRQVTAMNKQYEDHQLAKYVYFRHELEGYKQSQVKYAQEIEELRAQISQFEGVYKNELAALSELEAKLMYQLSELKQKKLSNPGEADKLFIERKKLRHLKQEAHQQHFERIQELEKELERKERTLERVIEQRRMCKKDWKNLKSTLVCFYLNCLTNGIDIREDGLRWIIKAVWKLEEAVPLSNFPSFLDELSACYLLRVTELELEIDAFDGKLSELKTQIRYNPRRQLLKLSSRELLDNVNMRIRMLSRRVVGRAVTPNRPAPTHYLQTEEPSYQIPDLALHEELQGIKAKINALNRKIHEITVEEVKRVVQEADSQTKEGVEVEHTLECLLGTKYSEYKKFLGAH